MHEAAFEMIELSFDTVKTSFGLCIFYSLLYILYAFYPLGANGSKMGTNGQKSPFGGLNM